MDFFAIGFLPRDPSVVPNRLSSPGKNILPWRTLNINKMVSRITSCHLSCLSFAMVNFLSLVRYGELECKLDADILELIQAMVTDFTMATDFAMAKWPLLLFWASFFDSCLVHSFLTQLRQVRHKKT